MEGAIDGIVQSVIQKALGGDIAAAKLVLDRIHVVPKSARISADLPDVTTAEGVIAARALIVRMVASGEIRTDEAESLSRVISDQQTAHDLLEMTTLMRQLEKR
ncbi:MAG: hypothetical protein IPN24_18435 [Betaproteobacteria bacterium]|nr:hypothetical protein [Betaproteobacteria bacterium]